MTDPKIIEDAADRFVRYGSTGLAVQGDLTDQEAAGALLAAVVRRLGGLDPHDPGAVAGLLVEHAIAGLSAGCGLPGGAGDAGRELLGALARWFGIDFPREVDALMEEIEEPRPVTTLTHGSNADCPKVRSGEWTHCKGHPQAK